MGEQTLTESLQSSARAAGVKTPRDWGAELSAILQRIERGKALPLDDSLAIADAAKQCGFCSTRQFATMFKHMCGVSPARFRRER